MSVQPSALTSPVDDPQTRPRSRAADHSRRAVSRSRALKRPSGVSSRGSTAVAVGAGATPADGAALTRVERPTRTPETVSVPAPR